MDLAKIRKKSLQTVVETVDERFKVQSSSHVPIKETLEPRPAAPAVSEADLFQKESYSEQVASSTATPPTLPERAAAACTPLEAILSGRRASGCDNESILAENVSGKVVAESCLEYIGIRVSDEIYGINIMDIKEIIKPRKVTEVPRAPIFVSGILSLRGTIIPIIDMRVRLGLIREEPTGKERIVVIKNANSFSGLLVDEVVKVMQVKPDAVEAAPAVIDGFDRNFISGLGRSDGRLIIILNTENIADLNLNCNGAGG
jgi:purine-binding chemotaxis protein CheW